MSPTDVGELPSIDAKVESEPDISSPPRSPRLRGNPYFWAGILIFVVIGGVAFNIALTALTENCTAQPSNPALYSVPSCGGLLVIALAGGIVGGIAVGLGVLLLGRAGLGPSRRMPLAAALFVALLLVVAVVPIAFVPPPGTVGIPPQLPFPIPVGTTFNVTQSQFGPYTEIRVPLDPYAPYAPIYIEGGWNATDTVCLFITRSAGADLGPGAHSVCGSSVAFAFGITSSTWTLLFHIPMSMRGPSGATVVITQSVEIVY